MIIIYKIFNLIFLVYAYNVNLITMHLTISIGFSELRNLFIVILLYFYIAYELSIPFILLLQLHLTTAFNYNMYSYIFSNVTDYDVIHGAKVIFIVWIYVFIHILWRHLTTSFIHHSFIHSFIHSLIFMNLHESSYMRWGYKIF